MAWPTLLAKRLKENKSTQHVAVVNQGISGNQVLRDGAGISALARCSYATRREVGILLRHQ